MGEPDLVIQIFSDVPEINCNYFIEDETISNAISVAMEYWNKHKTSVFEQVEDIDFGTRIKFAEITSINIIEITPR